MFTYFPPMRIIAIIIYKLYSLKEPVTCVIATKLSDFGVVDGNSSA